VIASDIISRRHVNIGYEEAGGWYVEDGKSLNGTFVALKTY
jgi:pSer/pThr/pTyr-binding forkhead associated (FHA) protein